MIETIGTGNLDLKEIDGAALAYVGDSFLEIYIRTRLIGLGVRTSRHLNAVAQSLVSADGQTRAFGKIESCLSEDEQEYFRRGRNSHHLKTPKSTTPQHYRISSGFEALLGYLYLTGNEKRACELLAQAYDDIEMVITETEKKKGT